MNGSTCFFIPASGLGVGVLSNRLLHRKNSFGPYPITRQIKTLQAIGQNVRLPIACGRPEISILARQSLWNLYSRPVHSWLLFGCIADRRTGFPLSRVKNGWQKERRRAMIKKSCTTGKWCLLFTGILSLLWACSPAMDSQAGQESKTREAAMNLALKTETDSLAIPPIDAAAPAVFETASFGLG
jgi:hypothetical protein